MAATPSVRVIKEFPYRGTTQRFSSRYHFNGGTPANNAAWDALFDAIVAEEKKVYLPAYVTIVECIGYPAGSNVGARLKTYTQAGTGAWANTYPQAGDVAALLRWSTLGRSSRNHPIYLFSFFHGVSANANNAVDTLVAGQKTALETYGTAWLTGFSDGSNTYTRASPNGLSATARKVDAYMTHRDFPR